MSVWLAGVLFAWFDCRVIGVMVDWCWLDGCTAGCVVCCGLCVDWLIGLMHWLIVCVPVVG